MTQMLDVRQSSAPCPDAGLRFERIPPYEVSLGEDIVAFAGEANLHLDPWQRQVLIGAMGVKRGGKWTARQVGLLVPRQNGKGSVLEARELYAMFVGDERLIIHSAHRYDTSQDHFRRLLDLIEGNPDLDRHVKTVSKVIGKESIILKDKTQLKFKARTLSGSGRGFTSDLLILDESFLLPEAALAAMLPTLSARPNPQTWFTSSSGTAESAALWRIVQRGRSGDTNLAYWEWGIASGVPIGDRSVWRLVNPGRASMESLEDDYATMTPEDFAREHLGAWDDQAEDWVIPRAVWESLADNDTLPMRPVGKVAFSVDVSPDRSRTSIAVAGVRPDGTPQVQVIANRAATSWVMPRLVSLVAEHESLGVVIDTASAAGSLIEDLLALNVEVISMTTTDAKQAYGQFFDSCIDGKVRHLDQLELNTALRGAATRPVGDSLLWNRKNDGVDITPLVAVTNALWGWTSRHASGDILLSVW